MNQAHEEMELDGEDTEFDEMEDFELGGEELETFEGAAELDETEEMELASQFLEISDEAELDQFIGRLIKRAGRAVGQFARSGAGSALGGILKGAARKALPMLGGAIGGYVGGPAGGRVGSQLAAKAGSLFGLELEGLSEEDQEFEVARRLVRFSDAAAKNLASAPSSANPQQAATAAAIAAAKRYAPGMIRATGPSAADTSRGCPSCGKAGNGRGAQGCPNCGKARSGRWIRRGRHIIIVNAHGSGQSRNKSTE
jgi:hypothetical protein